MVYVVVLQLVERGEVAPETGLPFMAKGPGEFRPRSGTSALGTGPSLPGTTDLFLNPSRLISKKIDFLWILLPSPLLPLGLRFP